MKILGMNTGHDRGCALLVDGKIVIAISEERVIRKKYAEGWLNSLTYCLDNSGGYTLSDIDLVVFSSYRDRLPNGYDGGLTKFGLSKGKCISVDHHLSHACSAFLASPFEKALIFVYDCHGNESDTESFYIGRGTQIKKIGGNPITDPLKGIVRAYEAFTCYFGWNSDQAGKTMGLAAYGDKTKFRDFPIYGQTKEGWYFNHLEAYYADGAEKLIKKYGLDIKPKYSHNTLAYKDAAAWIQDEFERVIIDTINQLQKATGLTNLCLSGGGALNSSCNGKILEQTDIKNLFIFPAASDKGECVGNALYGYYVYNKKARNKNYIWKNDYTGREYDSTEIEKMIDPNNRAFRENTIAKASQYDFKKPRNIARTAAKLIAEGNIIGWFQGGSELGPRALGHRSILCDPRRTGMKDILNRKVKHRESFRPFAPSVLLERTQECFELEGSSPFMLLVVRVKSKKRRVIPAVTHVDGTARIQTVTREDNGIYYDLIKEFYKLTKVPLILNTSFNLSGEPIVETPADAMRCFLKTKMDYLVLGPFLIWKK